MDQEAYEGISGDRGPATVKVESSTKYYRQKRANGKDELIFDFDKVSLRDILDIVYSEFGQDVPLKDVVFPHPHGFGNYYDKYKSPIVVTLGQYESFIEHDDSWGAQVNGRITLAAVIGQALSKTNKLNKARVGWRDWQMFLSVKK